MHDQIQNKEIPSFNVKFILHKKTLNHAAPLSLSMPFVVVIRWLLVLGHVCKAYNKNRGPVIQARINPRTFAMPCKTCMYAYPYLNIWFKGSRSMRKLYKFMNAHDCEIPLSYSSFSSSSSPLNRYFGLYHVIACRCYILVILKQCKIKL